MTCELPSPATLGHHVAAVVLVRAHEQVLRVAAQRGVAPMKDELSIGNFANHPLVDHPMNWMRMIVDQDFTVTVAESGTRPDPAFVRIEESGEDPDHGSNVVGYSMSDRPFNGSSSAPPFVVAFAPSSGVVGAVASVYRAQALHSSDCISLRGTV